MEDILVKKLLSNALIVEHVQEVRSSIMLKDEYLIPRMQNKVSIMADADPKHLVSPPSLSRSSSSPPSALLRLL